MWARRAGADDLEADGAAHDDAEGLHVRSRSVVIALDTRPLAHDGVADGPRPTCQSHSLVWRDSAAPRSLAEQCLGQLVELGGTIRVLGPATWAHYRSQSLRQRTG